MSKKYKNCSVQAIEAALSQDLDHVVGWLNQNYLMVSYSKTKVMLMGTHQKLSSVQSFTVSVNEATDTDIQQTLKWPSLQCRREYQKCIQIYKCINGMAPAYLLDDFHSSEQIHNYNTRNRDLIRLPLAKTTKFQTSFKYNAAKSWNTLPRNLRHDQSLNSFKHKIKKISIPSQLTFTFMNPLYDFFCFISIIYYLFILFCIDLHLNQLC